MTLDLFISFQVQAQPSLCLVCVDDEHVHRSGRHLPGALRRPKHRHGARHLDCHPLQRDPGHPVHVLLLLHQVKGPAVLRQAAHHRLRAAHVGGAHQYSNPGRISELFSSEASCLVSVPPGVFRQR